MAVHPALFLLALLSVPFYYATVVAYPLLLLIFFLVLRPHDCRLLNYMSFVIRKDKKNERRKKDKERKNNEKNK